MKAWKVVVIPTLITLVIGGIYLFSVWKHRQSPGVTRKPNPTEAEDRDEMVVMRAFFPTSFEDTLRLQGATVWMKDGYAIPYYPYRSGTAEFAHRAGLVPSLQRMEIKKIIKATPPRQEDDGMEHGSRQAFAIFAMPASTALYATPIGFMEGAQQAYYDDMLFFYDDPHSIYDYWPKEVWAAIDAHRVIAGMSELETRMAVGQKTESGSGKEGDRTVTYDQDGKKWTVTFVHNRAAEIKTS